MLGDLPATACCRGCGYLLRGLPAPVCPECGRSFDPTDPRSFLPSPRRHRARRWIVRGAVGLSIIALLFVFLPRRVAMADMTFTCKDCGYSLRVRRWEPYAASWLPIRYPGYASSTATAVGGSYGIPPRRCTSHVLDMKVSLRNANCGMVAGSVGASRGFVPTINGQPTTPETSLSVLKSLMSPSARGGIVLSAAPTPRGVAGVLGGALRAAAGIGAQRDTPREHTDSGRDSPDEGRGPRDGGHGPSDDGRVPSDDGRESSDEPALP
ncbi:MAG: hypothetical protein CHACPFDD_01469 [Phycisphaerae bacterium]|nr:hypothetical protein [Phycisphaerae bacterium]